MLSIKTVLYFFFLSSILFSSDIEKIKALEQRDKEVKLAHKLKKVGGGLMVTGGVSIGVGLLLILSDDTEPEKTKYNSSTTVKKSSGQSALGGGMALVGVPAILIGWLLKLSANSILEKDQGDIYQLSGIYLKANNNSLMVKYDF